MNNFHIKAVTPAIGAEISGVDLAQDVDDDCRAQILQAFSDHLVLFFRDQDLQPEDLVRFAKWFGPVGAYPFAEPIEGHPEVISIIKEEHQTTVFGGVWHTDSAYLNNPSLGSVLYAKEVPDVGGDTLFSNQYLAFETLDETLREKLLTATARHSSAKNHALLRADHLKSGAMNITNDSVRESVHPVVRKHPVTGKAALYLSPAHTVNFQGETPEESHDLLQELFTHALKDDFKCRFRWTPGTLAIWDNRCALHYPVNDYHGQRREMLRVTIDGDVPASVS